MLLIVLGFVGGLITGISPCVIPVLPVIFFSGGVQGAIGSTTPAADGDPAPRKPNRRRPYLVILGLVLSFSLFTLLGTVILTALHLPQDLIRWAGLIALVLLGIGLIVPRVQHWLEKPFSWIPQRAVGTERGGFVLGLALGAVYVPCAGPVLAAITVAGVTGKVNGDTLVLTLAFAIGTAIPLLFFALAGRGIAQRIKAFRTHQRAINVTGGIVMIALAFALSFNLPQTLQVLIPDYTSALQQYAGGDEGLQGQLEQGGVGAGAAGAGAAAAGAGGSGAGSSSSSSSSSTAPQAPDASCVEGASTLVNCGTAPPIAGISSWLNTPDAAGLSLDSLKGKVVLIDFWAYSCINCQRAAPHLNAWNAAYASDGLTIIGVHSPEYAFEHVEANVAAGTKAAGIQYPVALDNDFATWTNYNNSYWPAEYLIDKTGVIRHVTFGEGGYSDTEQLIRSLLQDADPGATLPAATEVADTTPTSQLTPEIYLDPARSQNYSGKGSFANGQSTYSLPDSVAPDSFALKGSWTADDEGITTGSDGGTIRLDYTARHVYLDVGGTGTLTIKWNGKTTEVPISGAPNIHDLIDADTSATGTLDVTLSPGLEAYSFTFG
jgi:cytochrome c biogenesis protein CcdA/thiol-disulfide isomerase/thioredoxin